MPSAYTVAEPGQFMRVPSKSGDVTSWLQQSDSSLHGTTKRWR
jgi:hypothetical protein